MDKKINPDYYTRFDGAEVIDISEHLSFCLGNVVKYCSRAGFKDDNSAVQDLKKARWYLDREISRLEKED